MSRLHLFAGLYPGKGIGHLVRASVLRRYFEQVLGTWTVTLGTNDPKGASGILECIGHPETVQDAFPDTLDILLIDSPGAEDLLIGSKTSQLVRMDYFDYTDQEVDVIINLQHKAGKGNPSTFKGAYFEGLQFAVIRDEIINARHDVKKSDKKVHILILFGGEDPRRNTLQVLEYLRCVWVVNPLEITVIRPPLFPAAELEAFSDFAKIVEPTWEVGQLYAAADIIICGGGTVLLEALYFGCPIIAIPQHDSEAAFIKHIGDRAPLFGLLDLPEMLKRYPFFRAKTSRVYKSLVDGGGKHRILDILKELPCG